MMASRDAVSAVTGRQALLVRFEEFKDRTVRGALMGWNGLENALGVDLGARSVADEQSCRLQGATGWRTVSKCNLAVHNSRHNAVKRADPGFWSD